MLTATRSGTMASPKEWEGEAKEATQRKEAEKEMDTKRVLLLLLCLLLFPLVVPIYLFCLLPLRRLFGFSLPLFWRRHGPAARRRQHAASQALLGAAPRSVAVIGGGPAGCSAAYQLYAHGRDVELFERGNAVGGRCRTDLLRGGKVVIDSGAAFFTSHYSVLQHYIAELGLAHDVVEITGDVQLIAPLAESQHVEPSTQRISIGTTAAQSLWASPFLTFIDKARIAVCVAALRVFRFIAGPHSLNIASVATMAPFDSRNAKLSLAPVATTLFGQRAFNFFIKPLVENFFYFPITAVSPAFLVALFSLTDDFRRYTFSTGMDSVCRALCAALPPASIHVDATVVRLLQGENGKIIVFYKSRDSPMEQREFDEVVLATTADVAYALVAPLSSALVSQEQKEFLQTQVYASNTHALFHVDISATSLSSSEPAAAAEPRGRQMLRGTVSVLPVGPLVLPAASDKPAEDGDAKSADKATATTTATPTANSFVPDTASIASVSFHHARLGSKTKLAPEKDIVSIYTKHNCRFVALSDPQSAMRELWQTTKTVFPSLCLPDTFLPVACFQRRRALPIPAPGRLRKSVAFQQLQHAPIVFAGDFLALPLLDCALRSGIEAAEKLLRVPLLDHDFLDEDVSLSPSSVVSQLKAAVSSFGVRDVTTTPRSAPQFCVLETEATRSSGVTPTISTSAPLVLHLTTDAVLRFCHSVCLALHWRVVSMDIVSKRIECVATSATLGLTCELCIEIRTERFVRSSSRRSSTGSQHSDAPEDAAHTTASVVHVRSRVRAAPLLLGDWGANNNHIARFLRLLRNTAAARQFSPKGSASQATSPSASPLPSISLLRAPSAIAAASS
eukprot:TRINITY_DN3279_c0_g1_i6.p1 TRINITY_DN3279_c0_g1~~TRINITY_DN3279_c0_g1_i6.p1  ORF type:complete len:848 (-),score=191.40 TRINITY_DN3279_c0_g1_i6:46-2589(-)